MRYTASWHERDDNSLGSAGGSWVPMEWTQARDTLADTLERNLQRWSDAGTFPEYQSALTLLSNATEPRNGTMILTLPYHELTLIRAE